MKSFISTPIRCSLVFLFSTLLVSGCSSSSDFNSGESETTANVSGTNGDGVIVNDGTDDQTNEMEAVAANDTTSSTPTESTDGTDESSIESADESVSDQTLPDSSSPVVVDPLIQNRIRVSFDISVPPYQSNELRLEVVWGDLILTASWVGDELWTVSSEFPTETQELLIVTFFDNNGAIKLASFSQQFKTGSNATEAFQISADQFNDDQFDDDRDGVSNLDELVAGNDPAIDEDSLLEIKDFFQVTSGGISAVAGLESLLSEERPISSTTQEQVTSSVTIDTDIQIDVNGNGTLNWDFNFSCEYDRRTGIRMVQGNTIVWEANRDQHDCDFTRRGNLINTITIVDENTRTYVESGSIVRTGSFTTTSDVETNLVGQLVEGTSLCEPVSGTFSDTYTSNSNGQRIITTFVSKEISDPYWRVTEERRERIEFSNTPISIEDYDVTTSEYFVRELSFGRTSSHQTYNSFICEFVDI